MTRVQNSRSKKRESFVLNFDEKKREDYLTGFSKRKQMRKEKAIKEKLDKVKELKANNKKKQPIVPKEPEVAATTSAFDIGKHSVVITEYDMFNINNYATDQVEKKVVDPKENKKAQKMPVQSNKNVAKKIKKPGKPKQTHRKSKTTCKTKKKHLKPSKKH